MHYEIWMEGFMMNGGGAGASKLGDAEGKDFREAVFNWYKEHPSPNFDPIHLTEWGCGLFPTREEAQRRFG